MRRVICLLTMPHFPMSLHVPGQRKEQPKVESTLVVTTVLFASVSRIETVIKISILDVLYAINVKLL